MLSTLQVRSFVKAKRISFIDARSSWLEKFNKRKPTMKSKCIENFSLILTSYSLRRVLRTMLRGAKRDTSPKSTVKNILNKIASKIGQRQKARRQTVDSVLASLCYLYHTLGDCVDATYRVPTYLDCFFPFFKCGRFSFTTEDDNKNT